MPDQMGLTDEFDGEIIASGGVRINAAIGATPPDERKVRWVRQSDGALIADVAGFDIGNGARVEVYANRDGIKDDGQAFLIGESGDGGVAGLEVASFFASVGYVAATVDTDSRTILDRNRDSSFAQRFNAGDTFLADNRFNGGVATPLYPGGSTMSNALAINHGLGTTPTVVLGTPNVDPNTTLTDPYTVYTYGYGAAQFTMRTMAAGMPGAGTGIAVAWLAFVL